MGRPDRWVRFAPGLIQPYIGSPYEAWQLNDLTWQRVLSLTNGGKMTHRSVAQMGKAAAEALDDPKREHEAKALDAVNLEIWASAVDKGWWPDAGNEEDAMPLYMAWVVANGYWEKVDAG